MAVVWIVHEIIVIFLYWNLPAIHMHEELEEAEAVSQVTTPSIDSDVEYETPDSRTSAGLTQDASNVTQRSTESPPALSYDPDEAGQWTPSSLTDTLDRFPVVKTTLTPVVEVDQAVDDQQAAGAGVTSLIECGTGTNAYVPPSHHQHVQHITVPHGDGHSSSRSRLLVLVCLLCSPCWYGSCSNTRPWTGKPMTQRP